MPTFKRHRWEVDEETGCWNWLLAKMPNGYGVEGWSENGKGRTALAHRRAYERANGPIPEGLQIDHLCSNRACVNPDHLEAVTQRENLRRGSGTKLSPADVAAIRASDLTTAKLARRYGIDPSYIGKIRRAEKWKEAA